MERDYKYLSLYLFSDTSKKDLEYFNNKYPFIYKKDIRSLILLIVFLLSFIPTIFILYFIVANCFLALALFWYRRRFLQEMRITYLDHLERAINKENQTAINAVYPLYIKYNNEVKELVLSYLHDEFLYCKYEDIKGFEIQIDGYKTKHQRLSEKPDRTAKSYKLVIYMKDGNNVELGLANVNRQIKLHKSYEFMQYANTNTINKLAIMLEKIMKKNKI